MSGSNRWNKDKRYNCPLCNIWTDNRPAAIKAHEAGKKHRDAVAAKEREKRKADAKARAEEYAKRPPGSSNNGDQPPRAPREKTTYVAKRNYLSFYNEQHGYGIEGEAEAAKGLKQAAPGKVAKPVRDPEEVKREKEQRRLEEEEARRKEEEEVEEDPTLDVFGLGAWVTVDEQESKEVNKIVSQEDLRKEEQRAEEEAQSASLKRKATSDDAFDNDDFDNDVDGYGLDALINRKNRSAGSGFTAGSSSTASSSVVAPVAVKKENGKLAFQFKKKKKRKVAIA